MGFADCSSHAAYLSRPVTLTGNHNAIKVASVICPTSHAKEWGLLRRSCPVESHHEVVVMKLPVCSPLTQRRLESQSAFSFLGSACNPWTTSLLCAGCAFGPDTSV